MELGKWFVLKVFGLMAAPRVVASTVSIPAVLVLHTDMAPFLFFLPVVVSNIFLLAAVA